ncbi:AMPK1_CBM domain-containing protein, partial [Meloidogyne graminicola]
MGVLLTTFEFINKMDSNGSIQIEEQLAEANKKIDELIEQNMQVNKLSNGDDSQYLRDEIIKMEQKLANANEEKEYYKPQNNGHSSRFMLTNYYSDDFGKELLLANKRKYQLESRVKQLEIELKEAQQRSGRLSELFELEKAQNVRLDAELLEAHKDCLEIRHQLDEAVLQGNILPLLTSVSSKEESQNYELRERLNNVERDYERRLEEMSEAKSKIEWRLGEVMQMYQWELQQEKKNYQKLLENNDKPSISDELERVTQELANKIEEKNRADWRIGELTQLWNDAKWRVGELEAETAHRSILLDEAHHKIGELERRLEGYQPSLEKVDETKILEEMETKYNDTKWRLGELEAELNILNTKEQHLSSELHKTKEHKSKVEWRLGEVMQYLNDAKWRIGELEACLENRNRQLQNIEEIKNELDTLKSLGGDREKWALLTIENTLKSPLKRILFETNSDGDKEIFLLGSFLNWECALICNEIDENKKGVWLDLPVGHYEFCFIKEGKFYTENLYNDCWNEFGTKNNWINLRSLISEYNARKMINCHNLIERIYEGKKKVELVRKKNNNSLNIKITKINLFIKNLNNWGCTVPSKNEQI